MPQVRCLLFHSDRHLDDRTNGPCSDLKVLRCVRTSSRSKSPRTPPHSLLLPGTDIQSQGRQWAWSRLSDQPLSLRTYHDLDSIENPVSLYGFELRGLCPALILSQIKACSFTRPRSTSHSDRFCFTLNEQPPQPSDPSLRRFSLGARLGIREAQQASGATARSMQVCSIRRKQTSVHAGSRD
jgi:hypothetical protein